MPAIPNMEEPLSLTQFLGEFKVMFNQSINPTKQHGPQHANSPPKQAE